MPCRHAPLAVQILLAVSMVAFWPDYDGVFAAAPIGFHIHGVTAPLWLILVGLADPGRRAELHCAAFYRVHRSQPA